MHSYSRLPNPDAQPVLEYEKQLPLEKEMPCDSLVSYICAIKMRLENILNMHIYFLQNEHRV